MEIIGFKCLKQLRNPLLDKYPKNTSVLGKKSLYLASKIYVITSYYGFKNYLYKNR